MLSATLQVTGDDQLAALIRTVNRFDAHALVLNHFTRSTFTVVVSGLPEAIEQLRPHAVSLAFDKRADDATSDSSDLKTAAADH